MTASNWTLVWPTPIIFCQIHAKSAINTLLWEHICPTSNFHSIACNSDVLRQTLERSVCTLFKESDSKLIIMTAPNKKNVLKLYQPVWKKFKLLRQGNVTRLFRPCIQSRIVFSSPYTFFNDTEGGLGQ